MNFSKIKNDYLIFLDNVRVDHIITSASTETSVYESPSSATLNIAIKFGRDMSDVEYDLKYNAVRDDLYRIKSSFLGMTSVIIMIKNLVSGNYKTVFNGNISDVFINGSRDKRFITLTISATGGMTMLSKIESLISLPVSDFHNPDSVNVFRLKSRGIDVGIGDTMKAKQMINFKDFNISEIVSATKYNATSSNTIYSDREGVMYFNAILDRLKVISDINVDFNKKEIFEMMLDNSTLTIESVYSTLVRILKRFMLEFYEAPYGDILIKTPFWNMPVPVNCVIPDIFMISENYQLRYSSRNTRTMTSGGVTKELYAMLTNDKAVSMYLPTAVFRDRDGNPEWSDIRNKYSTGTDGDISLVNINSMLVPSEEEKLFGLSMIEESQPVIKNSQINSEFANKAIKKYSAYRYHTVNSNFNTMSITTIAMPQMTPGFNCWVDPTGVDEIYYVQRVGHQINPSGVYTSLSLTMGRSAEEFFKGVSSISKVNSGSSYTDNIFVSQVMNPGLLKNMNQTVKNYDGYKSIKNKIIEFKTRYPMSYNIDEDELMKNLFSNSADSIVDFSSGATFPRMVSIDLYYEYSTTAIQKALDRMFLSDAPYLMKKRAQRIKEVVSSFEQIRVR